MTSFEIRKMAMECGRKLSHREFLKICNYTEAELKAYFSAPAEEKPVDPELDAFKKFNSLMRQAKTAAHLRAEAGEGSADDLCGLYGTSLDAIKAEEEFQTQRINALCDEAEQYYKLAKAWANGCRTQLEMVDEMRRRVAVNY